MSKKTISAKDAKDLAVRYSSFNEAYKSKDNEGMWIWGDMLQASQEATGIFMYDMQILKNFTTRARKRVEQAAVAA
jgi:hypothetical protein